MTPRTSSGNRKVTGLPADSRQTPGGFRKDSRRNPKRFQSPRVPPGTRDGYGMGKGLGKKLPRVPAATTASVAASEAWTTVLTACSAAGGPGITGWVGQISCVGQSGTAIAVEGPADAVSWVRRRYGQLLGNLVRETTDFTGIWIGVATEPIDTSQEEPF